MQDYGARWYNKALGRFIMQDPLIVGQKKYPWYSSYQFAGNKPTVAIDLDGKEDIWTHVTEFANGYKTEIQVLKGDDNYEIQKKIFTDQMGIDINKLPQSGALTTYQKLDESGKAVSMMAQYNMAVEVTAGLQSGIFTNEIGIILKE